MLRVIVIVGDPHGGGEPPIDPNVDVDVGDPGNALLPNPSSGTVSKAVRDERLDPPSKLPLTTSESILRTTLFIETLPL